MIDISQAVNVHNDQSQSLYEWFINQEHIPFDISSDGTYWFLYHQFLDDLNKLYLQTGDKYYWFTSSGRLVSDRVADVISANNIKIDKVKLRDIKINKILSGID